MKKILLLVLLAYLTACTLQNAHQVTESAQQPVKTAAITSPTIIEPKKEQKEEIFVRETTRKYGIELKYSGLKNENNLLCTNFYAEDLSKTLPKEDKDPISWFAYIYLSPDETLKMGTYKTGKDEEESTWSDKYCLIRSEIPIEYIGQEVRILYSTVRPDEALGESYLNLLSKSSIKTIDFKDKVR